MTRGVRELTPAEINAFESGTRILQQPDGTTLEVPATYVDTVATRDSLLRCDPGDIFFMAAGSVMIRRPTEQGNLDVGQIWSPHSSPLIRRGILSEHLTAAIPRNVFLATRHSSFVAADTATEDGAPDFLLTPDESYLVDVLRYLDAYNRRVRFGQLVTRYDLQSLTGVFADFIVDTGIPAQAPLAALERK